MKLNANLNFKNKSFNVSATLSILLVLILLVELWVAYSKMYQIIFNQTDPDVSPNVVRVNLQQYNQTIDYIKSLEAFEAPNLTLPRANIFR